MDSKIVNKHIRDEVRPLLKGAGFTQFSGRNSWRYLADRIDVINFQSFNSYLAGGLGCTTYSFCVNLGSYMLDIPDQYPNRIVTKNGILFPKEYECPFRGKLMRRLPQHELDRRDIWYIDPDGRYLEKAMHDVRMAIADSGFTWFERQSDSTEVFRILLEEEENMDDLWGFGGAKSPIRHYLTGYWALKMGKSAIAKHHLNEALSSGCFGEVVARIQEDCECAE